MNNTSYHCKTHIEVNQVQDYFSKHGYTFNGNKSIMTVGPEMNGFYAVLLHVDHIEKNMGFDYYYVQSPSGKLKFISKGRKVIEAHILFRDLKLKRILCEESK